MASDNKSPHEALAGLVDDALKVAQTARKHRKPLDGLNFYAKRIAALRADATNVSAKLPPQPNGDPSDDLIRVVFSADASPKDRALAARDIQFLLRTARPITLSSTAHLEGHGVFPLEKVSATRRAYLVSIVRQINGCYASGWFDACAVMMRRLLESCIIEAFEARKLDAKIKDQKSGDIVQLTALIGLALSETTWNLPRNVRKDLLGLKDLGHRSAHSRYYSATKSDVDRHLGTFREGVETFLHLANLI